MESMNKFKVLTICIIAMFIFVVAAIYSNTKDASIDKATANTENVDNTQDTNSENDTATQIKMLNGRIDELNEKINNKESKSNDLRCKIIGNMTENGLVETSSDDAIQEARANGNDIVISCSL